MVCFTQHQFKFNNLSADNWFKLLCKYYPGVSVAVVIDGKHPIEGKIHMDLFDSLPKGTDYEITTDRFWAELASIQAMPTHMKYLKRPGFISDDHEKKVKAIAGTIDSVISSRLSHGGHEIFIQNKFDTDNFQDVILATRHLNQTAHITRIYTSLDEKHILLVLDDRHTIRIGLGYVGDGTVPVFDIDDGFSQNAFGMGSVTEWNTLFKKWSDTFKMTNGDTWNDPILF